MRMDDRLGVTAEQIVNTAKRIELARIIHEYGEEPKGVAIRYADAIIKARPLQTTGELAETIKQAHVGKWQKIHPATRTFQGLRIQVNDELRQVGEAMPFLPRLLKKGGRVGVISFHSLEDRIVKRFLRERSGSTPAGSRHRPTAAAVNDPTFETPAKAIKASESEIARNPRARSATLRVARRTSAAAWRN